MDGERWPAEWLRGVLELCVLAVVAEGETYGYAVIARLREAGLGTVKGGTLYPVLARLEVEGLLTSSWRDGDNGPGRKYYVATPAGRRALQERGDSWRTFTSRAGGLLAPRTVDA